MKHDANSAEDDHAVRHLATLIAALCAASTTDAQTILDAQIMSLAGAIALTAMPNLEFAALDDAVARLRAFCLDCIAERISYAPYDEGDDEPDGEHHEH